MKNTVGSHSVVGTNNCSHFGVLSLVGLVKSRINCKQHLGKWSLIISVVQTTHS